MACGREGRRGMVEMRPARRLMINSCKGLSSIMKFTRALLISVSAAGLCVSVLAQTPSRADPGPRRADAAGRPARPGSAAAKESSGEVKAVTQAIWRKSTSARSS